VTQRSLPHLLIVVWRATDTVSDNRAKNRERIDKSIEKMFGHKFLEND
jgi:hypothetical protein